jgi:hypothetical protein
MGLYVLKRSSSMKRLIGSVIKFCLMAEMARATSIDVLRPPVREDLKAVWGDAMVAQRDD